MYKHNKCKHYGTAGRQHIGLTSYPPPPPPPPPPSSSLILQAVILAHQSFDDRVTSLDTFVLVFDLDFH
eukprot:760076-Hanusia_phi.AAC.1